jgi:hypothetical protein
MQEFYENDNRTSTIEAQITGDYMVAFFDKETSDTQYETFHTVDKAISAAERWLEYNYTPL